jgi:hypothetical protein
MRRGPSRATRHRFSAGLRHLSVMLEDIESAAMESSEGQPRDDVALLGLRLARAARG